MASHDQVKKKIFKHILKNPFATAWPLLGEEHTQSFANLLAREIEAQAAPAVCLPQSEDASQPCKRRRTAETNVTACAKRMLVLGITNILETQARLAVIVVLRSTENQVLVEPLLHYCRFRRIRLVAIPQEIAQERLGQVTGVRRLAAFAIPQEHNLPVTMGFLTHHAALLPALTLFPVVLSKVETTSKSA